MSDHRIVQPPRLAPREPSGRGPLKSLARHIMLGFQRWQRHKAIAQLQSLDDRQLEDIGISRNDIPRVVDGLFPQESLVAPAQSSSDDGKETPDQLRKAA